MSILAYHLLGALAALIAIPALLIFGFAVLGITWCKNVFRAGDKTVAAILGFSGYATLSAECGRLAVNGTTWPAAIIDFIFGKGHCLKAALDEKLLPEPR